MKNTKYMLTVLLMQGKIDWWEDKGVAEVITKLGTLKLFRNAIFKNKMAQPMSVEIKICLSINVMNRHVSHDNCAPTIALQILRLDKCILKNLEFLIKINIIVIIII